MDLKQGGIENSGNGESSSLLDIVNSKDQKLIKYTSIEVNSLQEGVEKLENKMKDNQNLGVPIILLDFDQTITNGPLTISKFLNPEIPRENILAFNQLLSLFPSGSVCITTNRNDGSGIAGKSLNTDKALSVLVEFLEKSNHPGKVPIFLDLKKPISGIVNSREELISYLVNYAKKQISKQPDSPDIIQMFVFEDSSFIGLDRSVFPEKTAKDVTERLKKEHNIKIDKVNITDYLIKH